MRLFVILLLVCIMPAHAESPRQSIRFGLTAVVVTENLRFLDQWSQYLGVKIGRKVEFVLRKSYGEVMDLLKSGGIEFAWICGYPFVQARYTESLQLLTVPVYRGQPRYHSYIIVHDKSPYKEFGDLKGSVFAFSDPDSNSGFLYPLSFMSKKGYRPETFFRQTFFTFNHAETVQAIAEQVADAGAVDSYIWDYLVSYQPDVTKQTRVINTSPSFGFPPIVSRTGTDRNLVRAMKETLENMNTDPQGKVLLDKLKLDAFGNFPDSIFDEIRVMAKHHADQ